MTTTRISLLFTLLCLTQVLAAPKPIDWKEVGRRALDIGKKAIPVGCRLLNGAQQPMYYPPYPPYQYQPYAHQYGYQYPSGKIPLRSIFPQEENVLQEKNVLQQEDGLQQEDVLQQENVLKQENALQQENVLQQDNELPQDMENFLYREEFPPNVLKL